MEYINIRRAYDGNRWLYNIEDGRPMAIKMFRFKTIMSMVRDDRYFLYLFEGLELWNL